MAARTAPMTFLPECFADLHIHIGRTMTGRPVKITASRNLTLTSVLEEALRRKGMHMVGIIDCHSPDVQAEIDLRMQEGLMRELPGGGYQYAGEEGEITLIAGVELELHVGHGLAHFLVYLPNREAFASFRDWYQPRVKNIHLSTQRVYAELEEVVTEAHRLGGIVIPAHAFTPHKSIYGACTDRLSSVIDPSRLAALELGLSSDSVLADGISELHALTFVTNSDAHSTAKIAREYQNLHVKQADFTELCAALARRDGRCIKENYGLHPQLGKYYRTRCTNCGEKVDDETLHRCPHCGMEGSRLITRGVYERFSMISDRPPASHPSHRPPYRYHVPLEFVPGLGPGRMKKLLGTFGTEMNIIHHAPYDKMEALVGREVAQAIERSRQGDVSFLEGGAGVYGKISLE